MINHTKGPWIVEDSELIANNAVIGMVFDAEDYPCNYHDFEKLEEECRANAKLITSAPVMYNVLRKIEEIIEASGDITSPTPDTLRRIKNLTRIAIEEMDTPF